MSITSLQKTGVLEILFYLHTHKKASRTDLRDNIHAVLETLYKTSLPTLKQLGLIRETKNSKFPFTVEIVLTRKGEEIAKKVVEINEMLEST